MADKGYDSEGMIQAVIEKALIPSPRREAIETALRTCHRLIQELQWKTVRLRHKYLFQLAISR